MDSTDSFHIIQQKHTSIKVTRLRYVSLRQLNCQVLRADEHLNPVAGSVAVGHISDSDFRKVTV